MNKNYKYYNNCINNASYERGSEGISVMNKRALQNLCKKADVDIIDIKGEWNGYTYPIVDRYINNYDITTLKEYAEKNKITEKQKKELKDINVSFEDSIVIEAEQWLNKNYPNAPENTINSIIDAYQSNGRRISQELLNRLPNLLIAHVRHQYTDYEMYITNNQEQRKNLRYESNQEAEKIIKEWEKN